jgi:hypothetical protein
MSAYVRQLEREALAAAAARSGPRAAPAGLRDRFIVWFNSLPEPTRYRPFSMREFEVALGAPGRLISSVLVVEGWRRKRAWATRAHYHRYWVPPVVRKQIFNKL